ncbi:MAG: aminotransferase class I/II-fold pyridoxal phosphate-dependent enzyme [Bacteroidota bacterium]
MNLNNTLIHLGEERDKYFHAVAPPIIQTSNFAFPDLATFRIRFASEYDSHVYTRGNNPTVQQLRKKVAALEGTEDCLVFASGAAAVSAAVISQVSAGDHVICVEKPYSWTKHLFSELLPRFGVSCTYVEASTAAQLSQHLQKNTKLIYLESPNSLTFELQDLESMARLAKEHGIITAIDNSHCSPLFQQPAAWGIDLVIHSATKYINGHSDVVMGVVCGSKRHCEAIFASAYMCLGAIPTAQSAALALRGLRTLKLRMERSDTSALWLAQRLEAHPKVAKVIHPLLASFPQAELAKKQMTGNGGLFTVQLATQDKGKVEAFVHRIERFLMAVSWGGYESLMLPLVAFYDIEGREDTTAPVNMIRFYIGLEDPEWLWEDLENALSII